MYGELEQKKKRKTKQKKLKTETGFLFGVVEGGGAGGLFAKRNIVDESEL